MFAFPLFEYFRPEDHGWSEHREIASGDYTPPTKLWVRRPRPRGGLESLVLFDSVEEGQVYAYYMPNHRRARMTVAELRKAIS